MVRPARWFGSKNRRTPVHSISRPPLGDSLDERRRLLHAQAVAQWPLPLCLALLALYEWWRWLFSIPANPLVPTFIATAAGVQAARQRKPVKAELAQLEPEREAPLTVRQLLTWGRALAQQQARRAATYLAAQAREFPAASVYDALRRLPHPKHLPASLLPNLKKYAARLHRSPTM